MPVGPRGIIAAWHSPRRASAAAEPRGRLCPEGQSPSAGLLPPTLLLLPQCDSAAASQDAVHYLDRPRIGLGRQCRSSSDDVGKQLVRDAVLAIRELVSGGDCTSGP